MRKFCLGRSYSFPAPNGLCYYDTKYRVHPMIYNFSLCALILWHQNSVGHFSQPIFIKVRIEMAYDTFQFF